MTAPKYVGLQQDEISTTSWDDGKVVANVIAGKWNNINGAFDALTELHLAMVQFKDGGQMKISIPKIQTIFLYVIKGELSLTTK